MSLAIRTEHLTKIYGNRLVAVNDLTLEVPKGSVFGLLSSWPDSVVLDTSWADFC